MIRKLKKSSPKIGIMLRVRSARAAQKVGGPWTWSLFGKKAVPPPKVDVSDEDLKKKNNN